MNFFTTSMPALSSFRARMYSWVKSLSLGHFPKSWRERAKAELWRLGQKELEKGDVTHDLNTSNDSHGKKGSWRRLQRSHLMDLLAGRGHQV